MKTYMKEERLPIKIWYIAYPFLYYYAIMLVVMALIQWVLGTANDKFVLCQMISSIVTLFFMIPVYLQDMAFLGQAKEKFHMTKEKLLHILAAVVIALCIGTAINNMISMTPLVQSAGYKEANEGFYGSTLALELVSSALFTPILEELVFRGIIFNRLKNILEKPAAVLLSTLIFASVHFNIVQFIYALLLGIVLALLMERAGNVYAAMAGHMAVNALAVVRTETGLLEQTVKGNAFSWIISAVLFVVGILLLLGYLGIGRKEKNN